MIPIEAISLAANVTESKSLELGCTRFGFQCRTSNDVLFWFNDVDGYTNGDYMTLKADHFYYDDIPEETMSTAVVVYLRATANVIVEFQQVVGG